MHKIQVAIDPSLSGLGQDTSLKKLNHTFRREAIESSEVSIIFGNKTLLQDLKNEFFQGQF